MWEARQAAAFKALVANSIQFPLTYLLFPGFFLIIKTCPNGKILDLKPRFSHQLLHQ
jgi:regulator of sirC expression with transglutaminase-like and TPR domain